MDDYKRKNDPKEMSFKELLFLIKDKRKILGMSGFGGQNIMIDFEKGRIIVINSRDRHYNWKKIALKKLKKK